MKKLRLTLGVAVCAMAFVFTGCGYDNNSLDVSKIDVDKYVTSIGDYNNLSIEVEPLETVSDDTVQEYIDYILSSRSELKPSEKVEVETGDIVNIDYEGKINGETFDGGSAVGYNLTIGSGTFIKGYEDGLIGKKVGDEVVLDLQFPDDYAKTELAGKPVVFTVKINHIGEYVTPELTDEFVQSLAMDDVKTVQQYRDFIESSLTEAMIETHEDNKKGAAQTALVDICTFEDVTALPLYDHYVEQVRTQASSMAQSYGMSLDDMISLAYGDDKEAYESAVASDAEAMTKDALACAKVARLEKITISDEDYNAKIAADAADYGFTSVDEFKAQVPEEDYRNYLLQTDVMDLILKGATVTEKAAEE